MTISFTALLSVLSESTILARGLELAQAVGLKPTTWRVGDPTRSLYKFLAGVLAQREAVTAEFVRSAVLSTARGDWLTVVAREVYGVERVNATYGTTTVTVANSSGAHYYFGPSDVTLKNSATGATYRNVGAFNLIGAGSTATVTVQADDPGSGSNAGEDEIDLVVTSLEGVSVTSSAALTADDEQTDESLREQCRLTLGALSPNGPADAYAYVVTNPTLTGTTVITKAAVSSDSASGLVTIYVDTTDATALTLAQNAVDTWAKPLCITPTVYGATPQPQRLTAIVRGTNMPGTLDATLTASYAALLQTIPIGGRLSTSSLIALIYQAAINAGATGVSVTLQLPASDVVAGTGVLITPGPVTITEIER